MKLKIGSAVLGVLTLVGCTLTKSELRQQQGGELVPTVGGAGQLSLPKQCAIKLVILSRPPTDTTLNETLWRDADLQSVGDESRSNLEANGIRAGVVTGDLPSEVRAILEAPPPNQIDPMLLVRPDGEASDVDLAAATADLDLLLNRHGAVSGKRYKDAKGRIKLYARREGEEGVTLRIVPEVLHGPIRQGWGPAPGGGAFAPQQLVMRNGQEEETLRDLAATVTLHAGQVLLLSAQPEMSSSLGNFLFTDHEPNSDRPLRKVLFIWATRSEDAPTRPNLTPADPPVDAPQRRASARTGVAPDVSKE